MKWWLLPVVIPLLVLILVLRGCYAGRSGGVYSGDDTSPQELDVPELQVERERPSIMDHFVKAWQRKLRGEEAVVEESVDKVDPIASSLESKSAVEKRRELEVAKNPDIPADVSRLIKRSDELRQGGDFISARMILEKLRLRPDASTVRPLIEQRIGELNSKLIFSDKPMPGKLLHTIRSGDLISRLTRRYGNTEEYIMRVNAIDRPEKIRIGQELWVLDKPSFELMIDKSEFKAVLLFNNRFFKNYSIGVGVAESAPAGNYDVRSRSSSINSMQEEMHSVLLRAADGTPEVKGFRLHAAENESVIGRSSENSGILFSQAEAEELYVLLSAGSAVTIVK